MSPATIMEWPEACRKGLTPECFKKHPKWAKQMFAQRFMRCLLPPWLTRRLYELYPVLLEPPIPPPVPPGPPVPPVPAVPPVPPIPPVPPVPPIPPGPPVPPIPPGPIPPWPIPPHPPWPPPPGPPHPPHPIPPGGPGTQFTSENDGWINQRQATWIDTHDATSGLEIGTTDDRTNIAIRARRTFLSHEVFRSFIEFDLTSISPSKTISSATITIHGYSYANCKGLIQKGLQSDNLALADFNNFSGAPFKTLTMTTGSMVFTLNLTGRHYIESKFGSRAKFCIREYDHDYLNTAPGMDQNFVAGMYYSETTEPGYKPTLNLVYS